MSNNLPGEEMFHWPFYDPPSTSHRYLFKGHHLSHGIVPCFIAW